MAAATTSRVAHPGLAASSSHRTVATDEPFWVRALLITLALAFFGLFLLMPLAVCFQLPPSLARCRRVGFCLPVINTQHISGKLCRLRGVAVVHLLNQV